MPPPHIQTVHRMGWLALMAVALMAVALVACEDSDSPQIAATQRANPSVEAATMPAQTPEQKTAAQTQPDTSPTTVQIRPIHFTDVTASAGIDMTITCGELPSREILEVNGGGLGLIDFDGDGDLDLFVANGATLADPEHGPGCRLFENITAEPNEPQEDAAEAETGIRFRDVTVQSGIDLHRWAMGVAVGDYDGDRMDDIFVSCYGPDVLLRNAGNGRFEDVTAAGGLKPDQSWGASAAFGDIDNDNDLDLYVCNYLVFDPKHPPPPAQYKGTPVMAGPHGLTPQPDFLYENLGNGTFQDITDVSGCGAARPSFGLNVLIVDFDADGWQDIYVANDSMPAFYFHSLGMQDGHVKFEEIGVKTGIASNIDGANQAAMGIALGDVDANGFPDKFITVFSSDTNTLHVNLEGKYFEDRSQKYGLAMISRPYLGWSCGFFDFDHDGDEDLMMVNGHVYPNATMASMDSEYEQTPLLFAREGPRFKRLTPETAGRWLAEKHRDRNAVFADLDDDGDIDIIVGELNGPIRVLRNDLLPLPLGEGRGEGAHGSHSSSEDTLTPDPSPKGRGESERRGENWLIVELNDTRAAAKNHRGLGAKIELIAGNHRQTRWLFTGGGFQSSGAPYVHFGLPTGVKQVSLEITWPDKTRQTFPDAAAGQHLLVNHPSN